MSETTPSSREQRGTQARGRKSAAPHSPHHPAGGRDSRDKPVIGLDSGAQPAVNRALTPGRRRRVTENDEYAAFARRVLRAWARRVAAGDIDAITAMAAAVGELEDAIRQGVAGLRGKGYSWAEIAARLGVTRQAAQHRWGGSGRVLPAACGRALAGCLPDGGHGTAASCAQPGGSRRRACSSPPPVCGSRLTDGVPLTAGRHSRPRRSTGRQVGPGT